MGWFRRKEKKPAPPYEEYDFTGWKEGIGKLVQRGMSAYPSEDKTKIETRKRSQIVDVLCAVTKIQNDDKKYGVVSGHACGVGAYNLLWEELYGKNSIQAATSISRMFLPEGTPLYHFRDLDAVEYDRDAFAFISFTKDHAFKNMNIYPMLIRLEESKESHEEQWRRQFQEVISEFATRGSKEFGLDTQKEIKSAATRALFIQSSK